MEPRLTPEKIEYVGKVDKGEIFAPAFTVEETLTSINNEADYLKHLNPTAVITGSYVTIPVIC